MFRSLRLRLLLVFAIVLLLAATAAWALVRTQAQRLASNLQDENLAAMAFGFFASVTASAGSWVTPEELESFFPSDLDQYYYRLLGPQGAYISGYNFVQVPIDPNAESGVPYFATFEDSTGEKFRGIGLRLFLDQPDYPGWVTLQVAQSTRGQLRLIDEQMRAFSFAAIGIALVALGAVAFLLLLAFRPLQRLASSVEKRGQHDLSAIRQPVPPEVQPLKDRLNNLFINLADAQRAKDRVIGNAAHQLRTPLTAIRLNASLAAKDAEPLEFICKIDEEACSAAKLTEDLLKLEHNPGHEIGQSFDLAQVCTAVFYDWEGTFDRHQIDSTLLIRGSRQITGRSDLMVEVLTNLFDNTIKHSACKNVKLECRADGFIFCDDGIGTNQENPSILLERFYRGAAQASGHGLGLSIAQEFCERLGGALEISKDTSGFVIQVGFADGLSPSTKIESK